MPTAKQLDKMIRQQELFVKQVQLTLALLQAYKRDSRNDVFISEELKEKCHFDEKYLDESFDEIACWAAYHNVGFAAAGGLFRVITIVPKKNRATMDELIGYINTHDFENI
jgi:hypothetical protein